ncbi:unnamed protein product [Discosporangium mesarthrocarpum]
MLGFFTQPSPDINYNAVVGAYLVCCTLLPLFYVLDKVRVYNVEAIEGTWIVFSPFVPCLLWALVVRAKWIAGRKSNEGKTKEH